MTDNTQQQPSLEPTGKWTDMRTGDISTVKTMVNDSAAGGAQIMFTDGRVIPFSEFSTYYIQAEEYDEPHSAQSHSAPLNISLLTAGMGTPTAHANNADENIYNENTYNSNNNNNSAKHLVSSLIDNLKERPALAVSAAVIENMPYDAISAIIKYFNVSEDDIADAIVDKFVSVADVTGTIKDIIRNNIKENI